MTTEHDLPLVNTSDLNQYLYCPRRLYYLMFYHTQGLNFVLAEGRSKHAHQSRRGQWYREMYLRSEKLHLHGKIDLLEGKTKLTPVERKHGTSFFDNDEVQLAAYCMLLEDYLGEPVRMGYLYLFGTNERYAITITDWHREKVMRDGGGDTKHAPGQYPGLRRQSQQMREVQHSPVLHATGDRDAGRGESKGVRMKASEGIFDDSVVYVTKQGCQVGVDGGRIVSLT